MPVEIRVPPLGESVVEATVGRWTKKAGEAVAKDEVLVELETDKITVEVAAPSAGVLSSIAKKEGDTVGVNELLGAVEAGAAAPAPPADAAPAGPTASPAAPAPAQAAATAPGSAPTSPAARRIAADEGVDLAS